MNALCALVAGAALAVSTAAPAAGPAEAKLGVAIVARDQVVLRAAPRGSGASLAVLWQGELLEVRGERMDYLRVYDHSRERGGFVRASEVRRTLLAAGEAPDLLAVVRFLRDAQGAEALGIGFAAAYLEAAPAEELNGDAGVEALEALGTFADRLARRASSGAPQTRAARAKLSAQLDVAARYGIVFASTERGGRVQICYDGDAFRRVLAMRSSPEQRARAALALTRGECIGDEVSPLERNRIDQWRADVLGRADTDALPPYLKNRVRARRAGVWASLAFQRARRLDPSGEGADAAEERALKELAGIDRSELADADAPAYRDAAMRVNASRWAFSPAPRGTTGREPHLATAAGKPGETCIVLLDAKNDTAHPLAARCTYGLVWLNSATQNREANALAVAVQPLESWRELWVFRRSAQGWKIRVLPPAVSGPGVGYAEFAGWVPGGRKMLVVREARGEAGYRRSFEVVRLDTLAVEARASDPSVLGAFRRWQDPAWRKETVSMR